jgi:hypothetical protein
MTNTTDTHPIGPQDRTADADRAAAADRTAHAAVSGFLDDIAAGRGISPRRFSAGATLDATVPGWRFTLCDGPAIAAEYGRWFADTAVFESLDRWPMPGGEIVRYELAWSEHGVPHAAHHCHFLEVDADGLIRADTVFCGGRWDAALLARMAEASR